MLFQCTGREGSALTSDLRMLHQRWPSRCNSVVNGCWLWPCSPIEIYCLVFTSRSLICWFMSLFQQPELYITLCVLCWVRCLCLSVQSPQRRDFSLTQRPFAVTLFGITEGKVPTELPSGCSTIQRPPTEWEEAVYCVFLSECLADEGLSVWQWPVFPSLQQNSEEKPRADFWCCIYWWKYVRLLLDRGGLQSPPPGGQPNNILQWYKNRSYGPQSSPITA